MFNSALYRMVLLLALASVAVGQPPVTRQILVPDYAVTKTAAGDMVRIPGGTFLNAEEGRPKVPLFGQVFNYEKGWRVQKVELAERGNVRADSGLSLPVVILSPDGSTPVTMKPGTYPERDFDWQLYREPDGSSRLSILVYPFRYDPSTTKSTFYRSYTLNVPVVHTTVGIAGAEIADPVIDPDSPARVRVRLENSGAPHAVTVRAEVFKGKSTERVADVAGRRVAGLGAADSVDIEWPTAGVATGDYAIDIIVADESGRELDRERVSVRVGSTRAELTRFAAEPEQLVIGEPVKLVLEFRNTGTSTLSGAGVFLVTKDDQVVAEDRREFTALGPGAATTITDTWNTSGAVKGAQYRITGSAEFEGTSSDPKTLVLSTNQPPMAAFSPSADTCRAGEGIEFDASASKDSDGSVVEYLWDFGDEGDDRGEKVTHNYALPGDYRVVLTVKDNEGGTGAAEKTVTVKE